VRLNPSVFLVRVSPRSRARHLLRPFPMNSHCTLYLSKSNSRVISIKRLLVLVSDSYRPFVVTREQEAYDAHEQDEIGNFNSRVKRPKCGDHLEASHSYLF